jgi:hypothetical protein
MRKSFTWFLSLMVLLTAFATHGYAQEAQETVELYAEDASYCYNEANDYTVTISVRDFIKLNQFELNLEFNDEFLLSMEQPGFMPHFRQLQYPKQEVLLVSTGLAVPLPLATM